MILLIDNYDSFAYNLYQMVGELNPDIRVVRNDELTVEEIRELAPSHIILSPGPGKPADAGVCEAVAAELSAEIPVLGVCLGHQGLCEALGATVGHAKKLMHGKQSTVSLTETGVKSPLFAGFDEDIKVARYHSLSVDADTLPPELVMTAVADDGEVMAVEHEQWPLYGVQFHPESILTPNGKRMLSNFLAI